MRVFGAVAHFLLLWRQRIGGRFVGGEGRRGSERCSEDERERGCELHYGISLV
jgi:hypothetical protein